MMPPINMDLKGGSSEASSKQSFDQAAAGGGGSRGPTYNIATGASRLAASTGSGLDTTSLVLVAVCVMGGLYFMKRKG